MRLVRSSQRQGKEEEEEEGREEGTMPATIWDGEARDLNYSKSGKREDFKNKEENNVFI